MQLFDILAQLLQVLIDLVPRVARRPSSIQWLIVDPWLGTPHCSSRPCVYWPILDYVEYWPKTEQPINADIQTCVTADDVIITVNPQYSYRILSPLVVRELWGEEFEERICMVIRGAIEEAHAGHNWSHVRDLGHDAIVAAAKEELYDNGVELTYFCVEERAPTKALRLYGFGLV